MGLLFYSVVKTLYTLGHSLSLIALITSTLILCLFRCWERNDIPTPRRVIDWPIMASVISRNYAALTWEGTTNHNTVNYMVFVYLVETESDRMEEYKILFDLVLGSFQGLVVAILYCFLNTEVQGELKLKWRRVSLKRYMWRDYRLHRASISHNGTDNYTHFLRNSRAQSILQTETTSL
ncbi:unnamed protein product [Coregonus sp. 'balchen']|nr:unnamed protein product [Coregonus sp. 'balchen']